MKKFSIKYSDKEFPDKNDFMKFLSTNKKEFVQLKKKDVKTHQNMCFHISLETCFQFDVVVRAHHSHQPLCDGVVEEASALPISGPWLALHP